MLIKKVTDNIESEITPKKLYMNRRRFIAGVGAAAVSTITPGLLAGASGSQRFSSRAKLNYIKSDLSIRDEDLTPYEDITTYNNFFEFGSGKRDPVKNAVNFRTDPWIISIEGLVKSAAKYDVDSIVRLHPSLEERIYRMRCVETWSMVIPWIGIPLSSVIKAVEPSSKARFVAFETLHDVEQMPGQRDNSLPWPYQEGLRMDEALHPLTILAVGLYGEPLPNQDGAPIRLVVPWKYGFKSAKSIAKIRFVEHQPQTSWNRKMPSEYGFYSNVNPDVDHPRWSQKTERRIGELFRRKTLLFNGYGNQVASLYSGMDLRKFY